MFPQTISKPKTTSDTEAKLRAIARKHDQTSFFWIFRQSDCSKHVSRDHSQPKLPATRLTKCADRYRKMTFVRACVHLPSGLSLLLCLCCSVSVALSLLLCLCRCGHCCRNRFRCRCVCWCLLCVWWIGGSTIARYIKSQ